jgi:hypothetical protein
VSVTVRSSLSKQFRGLGRKMVLPSVLPRCSHEPGKYDTDRVSPHRMRSSTPSAEGAPTGGAGTNDLRSLMKDVAAQMASQSAGERDGLKSMFAARIAAASRSGMSAAEIAALVRAIRREMQAALRAAAERAAQEMFARTTSAAIAYAGVRSGRPAHRRQVQENARSPPAARPG